MSFCVGPAAPSVVWPAPVPVAACARVCFLCGDVLTQPAGACVCRGASPFSERRSAPARTWLAIVASRSCLNSDSADRRLSVRVRSGEGEASEAVLEEGRGRQRHASAVKGGVSAGRGAVGAVARLSREGPQPSLGRRAPWNARPAPFRRLAEQACGHGDPKPRPADGARSAGAKGSCSGPTLASPAESCASWGPASASLCLSIPPTKWG